MRLLTAGISLVLLIVTGAAFPSMAPAGWSAPQSVATADAYPSAVAVNARGDAAFAWARTRGNVRSGKFRTSVSVARRTKGGRLRAWRVWSRRRASVDGISVAVGKRGEVTVAWQAHRSQAPRNAVWASYTRRGRWTAPHVVGRSVVTEGLPPDRFPRLAVAPDRRVLLAWDAGDGPFVAWRPPGRGFGRAHHVSGAPTRPMGPIPAFDATGAAYLSGKCDVIVLRTRPRRRSFRRILEVSPSRGLEFTLSVVGRGQGLAGWLSGTCSTSEGEGDAPGPVFASVLRNGAFQRLLSLSPAGTFAYRATAVASPQGGGIASWAGPPGGVTSTVVTRDGILERARQITDGVVPVAADGGGDLVFSRALGFAPPALPPLFFVRPAPGGPDEPAPAPPSEYAVATPTGRAVAAVWTTPGRVNVSVWRP